jgi:predicted DCC family thiol-disulfide oxidoreductase YuxK
MDDANPIILYDGVCGLCNRLVQFLLRHDKRKHLRFASLQSDFAGAVLRRHGLDPKDLDTFHFVENYDRQNERVFDRSDAVLKAGRALGGVWAMLASVASLLPRALLDPLYRLVARNRYRVFGKFESCMLPDPSQRNRFLDT